MRTEWTNLLVEVELEHREMGDEARAEIARQIRAAIVAYQRRLDAVVQVIDGVHDQITDDELRTIYTLAGGKVES